MNEENMNSGTTGMIVNERMKADLLASAKWAKFLCIFLSIFFAFMVIAAIPMFIAGIYTSSIVFPAILRGFIFLIVPALFVYPLMKGFQFANGIKAACLSNDENELARGFGAMRSWFTYRGIIAIICLVLYALIFLIAIIAGFVAASQN